MPDPGAPDVAGWGFRGIAAPHFASVVAGTLPHVSGDSSNPELDHDPDSHPDSQMDTQVDEALDAMEAVRRQLAAAPAEVVVANHAMGLYELAAIHLSAAPPDLRQAVLAIDAFACLVEGLGERIGDSASTLKDALGNIRIAFVQIKNQMLADDAQATGAPG
jgi:hypothetical protein